MQKDKVISTGKSKAELLKEKKEIRKTIRVANLLKSKTHVTENDKSPGGFPFHFAGPAKYGITEAQKNKRNRAKRARKELR